MAIEPYTQSRIDYLARYLQTLLPGLNYDVAKTWITSEKGVSGNVLGLTYTSGGRQQLYQFSSQEEGLQAAANWVDTRSIYAGIKNSLSGTAQQQAVAISTSPWNSAYYPRVFANLIGNGGASTPITPSPSGDQSHFASSDAKTGGGTGGITSPLLDEFGSALSTPFIFIGVILVGITFIITGGLIFSKSKPA